MLRDHEHDYELGPGYSHRPDGTVCETYWQRKTPAAAPVLSLRTPPPAGDLDSPAQVGATFSVAGNDSLTPRKLPYHVELVGVTCDPTLAVARGFWRRLRSGRGVPVDAQLRSHRLFSANWTTFCKILDSATLYHTGAFHQNVASLFVAEVQIMDWCLQLLPCAADHNPSSFSCGAGTCAATVA
jgi:hypothetical protein